MDTEESRLIEQLRSLGLGPSNYRALALLPLVEVAWADATIQDEERRVILGIASGHDLLSQGGAQVLEGWLSERPSPEMFDLGLKLFVELAHRRDGIGSDIPEASLDFVVDLCSHVAESAGGLFGMFFQISPIEQATIRRVTDLIDKEAARVAGPMRGVVGRSVESEWQDMLEELATAEVPRMKPPSEEEQPSTTVFRAIKD